MKLIAMTDFVLNQLDDLHLNGDFENFSRKVVKYATFLKQPLKLEMFVPCDEIIEVMNYKEIKQSVIEGTDSWDAYEKAKEKVLFEYKPQFDLGIIKHHISQGRNIEYLANFGSMQLTKFALNAIFG